MAALTDLHDKRLIIVAGKGGVGRTTVAAALGVSLARQGRKTLLLQANAKEKLSQLLGGPMVGEEIVQMRENLWAVNTNPNAALHQYGLIVLRYETIYRMVFENKVAKALLRAIPGLDDYSIVGKIWWHATQELGDINEPVWDTVIFDAPATGHAVTMLGIPRAILDAVPEGPLTRDAKEVRKLLEDPRRTAVVVVTLAEEMPAAEAVDLVGRLRRLDLPIRHLVVNGLYPDRFSKPSAPARVLERALQCAAASSDAKLSPTVLRARTVKTRREVNERYLARLREQLGLHEVRLPMLFVAALGPEESERLADLLDAGLGAAGGGS